MGRISDDELIKLYLQNRLGSGRRKKREFLGQLRKAAKRGEFKKKPAPRRSANTKTVSQILIELLLLLGIAAIVIAALSGGGGM